MAFRQTGVARRLIVGSPPDQLTIDANGIRLPVSQDVPQDESTVEWYDPATGDPTAQIVATSENFLARQVLDIDIPDPGSPWETHLNLTSSRGDLVAGATRLLDLIGGTGLPWGARITSQTAMRLAAADDVSINAAGDAQLNGAQVHLGGPPDASSQHSAGRITDYTQASAISFPAAGGLMGNTTPVAFPGGRIYRVTLEVTEVVASVANSLWQIELQNAGSGAMIALRRFRATSAAAGGDGSQTWGWWYVRATTAALLTLRARVLNVTGGGTLAFNNLGFDPAATIVVEDRGPA